MFNLFKQKKKSRIKLGQPDDFKQAIAWWNSINETFNNAEGELIDSTIYERKAANLLLRDILKSHGKELKPIEKEAK